MPYGFDDEPWDEMFEAGLTYLESLARNEGDCDYTEFCAEVQARTGQNLEPHGEACSRLLERIGRATYDSHAAVVTAVVHYRNGGIEPGPGFFYLCHDLGIIEPQPYSDDRKMQIVVQEVDRVLTAYARGGRRP